MHIDRLDHLRFFASFMVMCWHFTHLYVSPQVVPSFPLFSLIEEGHTGVSFFCVISGFILTYIYKSENLSYLQFLNRRGLRILPLLLLLYALTYLVHRTITGSYAAPTWSVLIEIEFYLVFPFLLRFINYYGLRYAFGLWGLAIATRGLTYFDVGEAQNISYWTLFGRIDQFLAGMISAAVLRERFKEPMPYWVSYTLLLVGLAAISAFYHHFNAGGGYSGYGGGSYPSKSALWIVMPAVEAVGYAAVLSGYILITPRTGQAASVSNAILSYLGRISYSLYLMHWMVFLALHKALIGLVTIATWEAAALLFFATGLPAAILVSSATYYLIEKPFLAMKPKRTGPQPKSNAGQRSPCRAEAG